MTPSIQKKMCVFDVLLEHQTLPNSYGDTTTASSEVIKGYLAHSIKQVISYKGLLELSNSQIYFLGEDSDKVFITDLITCLEVQRQKPLRVDTFYLPNGISGVGVIYLV